MNNPLRYAGETFYQSGHDPGVNGREVTSLQVVTNKGWMVPYVSCMFVAVGLLYHFSGTLVRFLHRIERGAVEGVDTSQPNGSRQQRRQKARLEEPSQDESPRSEKLTFVERSRSAWRAWLLPSGIVVLLGLWLLGAVRRGGDRLDDFGELPIVYQGRIKPLDTLARNTLLIVSDRDTFTDRDGKKQPAIQWLADLVSGRTDNRRQKCRRLLSGRTHREP